MKFFVSSATMQMATHVTHAETFLGRDDYCAQIQMAELLDDSIVTLE